MRTVKVIPAPPSRPDHAHKGMVGRIAILAGRLDEYGMVGAAALVANAALRSGAGLTQIITSAEAQVALASLAPCSTSRRLPQRGESLLPLVIRDFGADVVAMGPGMAAAVDHDRIVEVLTGFSGPTVLDAEALNRLAAARIWRAGWPQKVVLTPHPGEMRRLLDAYSLNVPDADRVACAEALARHTGAVVVLKGHGTVITDTERVYINGTGNAGMATAGSGDVLTGVIAGLLGQGMDVFDAAVLGVYTHGLAGDIAAEELGRIPLTAIDILDYLPEAFSEVSDQEE